MLAEATFSWLPTLGAAGYRLSVDGIVLRSVSGTSHVERIDLTFGNHLFEIEAFNEAGFGPKAQTTRALEEPAPPPVPVPGSVQGFDVSILLVSQTSASSDPYDLSGFSIPYTVTWPTAPSPAGTETPTTFAALSAAIAAGNATITPADGTYSGNLTSWGNDIDLVLGNGVIIDGNISATGSARIRITGGSILGHGGMTDCDDWLFNNVYFDGDNALDDILALVGRIRRLAFINCTMESTTDNATWAIHTVQTDNGNGVIFDDITIANTKLDTSTGFDQVTRFNGSAMRRLTIVDSLINEQNKAAFGHRFMEVTDGFVGNVINVQGIHANWTAGALTHTARNGGAGGLTTNNLCVYDNVNLWYLTTGVTGDIIGTISNSRIHKSGGGTPTVNYSGFTDGGGNDAVAWDGLSSSIDYTRMPGKTSAASYGADH